MATTTSAPFHQLLVQTPKGSSHYKVAETDKLQDGIAEVTIIAGDWLDMGTYAATYQVGEPGAWQLCRVHVPEQPRADPVCGDVHA